MTEAITTAVAEYSPIAAVLADLARKHKGIVFDVTQPTGMKAAKAAAKDIAQYRIALEKKRQELKADVLERGRLIDGEARRIQTQLSELEDPIKWQIEAEERRIEEEREAAIRAEQERLAAEDRAKREAEERRLAEERARLQAEREAFEREQREARERAAAEERARREAEEKARRERQAEEERIAAERRKVDEERAALERAKLEKELAAKHAAEEAEREQRRAEQELMDGREMLVSFVNRFGHRKEFHAVVMPIKQFLEKPKKRVA